MTIYLFLDKFIFWEDLKIQRKNVIKLSGKVDKSNTYNGFSGNGWLVVWVLGHINLCRLFNEKPIFIQIISSISNNSV